MVLGALIRRFALLSVYFLNLESLDFTTLFENLEFFSKKGLDFVFGTEL